ncbi:glycosyltransferase family 4 protein [Marinobacter mobilis]|uniref:Glycosyltransferase involved in cell wall bisynthesis n=1 Tax=Marinobacter mobilis TaxID=488533 RepID=A0A1H3A7P3_9GAMM|nr:glycosyltransferase family 1 protein [Marinobacter mobilis]SDX25318.1 Glycosyltransferase involved in cell wall bisynthesis [Marinobacter mobilis]
MTEQQVSPSHNRHIVVVSETFPPEINGVANTLRHLCQGLLKQGHRISVVRPRQRHESTGNVTSAGQALFTDEHLVAGTPLPGYPDLRFGLTRSARLTRLWKRTRPDAIYVATQGPLGVAAVSAARQLGIPVSSGFHTNFHTYSRYYGAGFLEKLLCGYGRWFHNRTAITLVPTRKMQTVVNAMGVHPTGLWSRGVDCNRFNPHKRDDALRASWNVEANDRVVLYVGRLASEKNLQMAATCFERIRNLHPRTRFVLVGDGPLRKRMAERHPDYIFCGMQRGEDLARHYASGDIFLFPSKTDTFGNVVTEAMASGLAVVAYDDAAASEHISHEGNGMKADLTDDDGFIDAALKLVDQPTLLNRIRAQARLDALDLNWHVQIEQFEQLVLNQKHRVKYHATKQSIPLL